MAAESIHTRRLPAARRFGGAALLLALVFSPVPGAGAREQAASDAVVQVFVREGCPHCAEAKRFLAGLARERPELRIVYRPVDHDPAARAALIGYSRAAGVWPPGVPTFVYQDRVLVGFDDAQHSGAVIAALLRGAQGPDAGEVRTRLFGTLSASRLGLPLFTLALGLLDGFNPCAMWVLLFLLSLLVHLHDRRRMALIAGTFVIASGAVYFAFMAAWLNLFLVLGLSATLRWLLGIGALAIGAVNIKDFFAFGRGPSLSIPEAARPGLYARMRSAIAARTLPASMIAVAVLAVLVNFIELLCTAGFPAIFTAVLAQQETGAAARYGYLGLYILGYLADDSLMVAAAVVALSQRRLTERAGRWLKLVSGGVMAILGLVLIARPGWLI